MGGCHPWNNGKGESNGKPGFHHVEEIQLGGNMDIVDGYYPTPQVNHPDTQYRDPAVIPDSAFNDQYSCEIKGSNGNGFRSAMNQNICFYHEREHNQQDMKIEVVMRAVSTTQDTDSGVYIVVVGYRDWWGQPLARTAYNERILGQSRGDTGWITKPLVRHELHKPVHQRQPAVHQLANRARLREVLRKDQPARRNEVARPVTNSKEQL